MRTQAFRRNGSLMSPSQRPKCCVLYIDHSAANHFLFQRAVAKTEMPLHIQPFFSGEPAMAYLRSEAPLCWPEPLPVSQLYSIRAPSCLRQSPAPRCGSPRLPPLGCAAHHHAQRFG